MARTGDRWIELSMPFVSNVDDSVILRHVDVLGNADNFPLVVHCQHGVTRTAKFLSIYELSFAAHRPMSPWPHIHCLAANITTSTSGHWSKALTSNIKSCISWETPTG